VPPNNNQGTIQGVYTLQPFLQILDKAGHISRSQTRQFKIPKIEENKVLQYWPLILVRERNKKMSQKVPRLFLVRLLHRDYCTQYTHIESLVLYSQHSIFFVTYESTQ